VAVHADGRARIETYTVIYGPGRARTGVIIGRLEADGRRFVAQDGDDTLLDLLAAGEPVGRRVHVRSFGPINRATSS
jgi:acetyl-CoA C-acetyltransferase